MFLLLTRILLWLLIAVIVYYVLTRFIPKAYFTWLGGLIIFAFIVLAFVEPTNRVVSAVWELISLPLKPLGLVIVLLLSAIRDGTKKVIGGQVLSALLVLLISSVPITASFLAQQAELGAVRVEQLRRDICQVDCPVPLDTPQTDAPAAIVVFGDEVSQVSLPYGSQVQLEGTSDRLLYAAQLYREQPGTRPLVIVSTDASANQVDTTQLAAAQRNIESLLGSLGVPAQDVVISNSESEIYNRVQSIDRILDERRPGNNTIVLVSSGLDSRRATLTFSNPEFRVRVIPRPTSFAALQAPEIRFRPGLNDFIPNVSALALTTRVVEEYLSTIYYFLRGWLSPVGL